MLQIAWNTNEVIEAEPCEPQYSPILDRIVEADLLEVRTVDEGGRMGARVPDPDGDPLWVPVGTEPTELRYVLPGPGRYAVVARDHQGRHLGRNDVFARELGRPDPFRMPTAHERLKDELARERELRAAAEDAGKAERNRRLEAEAQTRSLIASLGKANREIEDLGRRLEARGNEADREHRRRRAAERALAEAEKAVAAARKRAAETSKGGFSKKELISLAMWVILAGYYLKLRLDRHKARAGAPSTDEAKPKRAAQSASTRAATRRAGRSTRRPKGRRPASPAPNARGP